MNIYTLSEFEKIKILKQSEHKTVYLVNSLKTDEVMIMKELDTTNQSYSKLTLLRHQNLQEVYDVFNENNKTYIICEYVMGERLDFIIQNEELTDKQIYHLILQLCDAVSFLHSQTPPIIHRDIKLSNIIINNDNLLKLIDYDTIRELKANIDYDTAFVGTRGYAPPEQYGFAQTDEKTDIYAIGILIYRLLGGYNEQNISHYKGRYRKVIQKSTAFAPEKRFKTVSQLKNYIKLERYRRASLVSSFTVLVFIGIICLSVANNRDAIKQQDGLITESSFEQLQKETMLCEFKIGETKYSSMGKEGDFSLAPVFDEENGDILVPIEILDSIPDLEYSIDYNNRSILIKKQNRKIEFSIASDKAYVDNFEVLTKCVPILEQSIYQIPINFTASNLGLYLQFNEEQQIGNIVDRHDNRILMNTNMLSFQFEKMNFNHSVPVLIGLEDINYVRTLNKHFNDELKSYYNTYRELYDNTIKNNAQNTIFTHNNYVQKQYFSKEFTSILMVDNDAQSIEDSDLNKIYRVDSFSIAYTGYNIDLLNKEFLQLKDLFDEDVRKNLVRERLIDLSESMEEDYQFINDENIDNIVSEMNGFFISPNKALTIYGNLKELSHLPVLAEFTLEEYESFLKKDLFVANE